MKKINLRVSVMMLFLLMLQPLLLISPVEPVPAF